LLGVGIDWAESFHDVALGRPGQGVVKEFRIEHSAAGVAKLVARCVELEPDPADIRVVLETRHGVLVETLIDTGFSVLPVNPDLVARRRGPVKASAWRMAETMPSAGKQNEIWRAKSGLETGGGGGGEDRRQGPCRGPGLHYHHGVDEDVRRPEVALVRNDCRVTEQVVRMG